MLLLSGCLPLPIAIQPYDSPITDGLALGEVEIRDSSGIDPQEVQAIVDEVLENGFIPLLYSGDGRSKDKLKFHVGESMRPPYQSPVGFHAVLESIDADTVVLSISLPDARPEQGEPTGPGRLQCTAGFSQTRWNDGWSSSWKQDQSSWDDQQRLIVIDWRISGTREGRAWTAELTQPALRFSVHDWSGGYGWLAGESPLWHHQIAY